MNFLTQETPGKVMALVGSAMVSLAFLFAVTLSNASFSQVYNNIPDPFGPQNVMATLDVASHNYAMFINQNLTAPAQQSFALAADNIAYVAQNATFEVAMLTGNQNLLPDQIISQPQVAGAYVQAIRSQ